MLQLNINPSFRDLIPPLSSDEWNQLEQNIISEGCRDPLVVWGDTIIDGHNRYEICTLHRVDFETVEYDFESDDDAKVWIIRNQFGRRNLPAYERARLALLLKPLVEEKARQNSRNGTSDTNMPVVGRTNDVIGNEAGVSREVIRKVETIERAAPLHIREKAQNGELSIHAAYEETRNHERLQTLPEPIRERVSEKIEKEHLSHSQARNVIESVIEAPSEKAQSRLLQWDYSTTLHDPEWIKERKEKHGAHDAIYQELPEKKREVLDVAPLIDRVKSWHGDLKEIKLSYQDGKMSPEGVDYITRRLSSFANQINQLIEEMKNGQ